MREEGERCHKEGEKKTRGKSNGYVCYFNYDDSFKDVYLCQSLSSFTL